MSTQMQTRKPRRQARPKMTADEARQFDATSSESFRLTLTSIIERKEAGVHTSCSCNPYDDVFTFNRWKAQGYTVRKGERAIRIPSYVQVKWLDKDKFAELTESGIDEEKARARSQNEYLKSHTHVLFCRCQVAKTETAS